jgi:hypothetical protein
LRIRNGQSAAKITKKRIVKVQLTDEQIEVLSPREIGTNVGQKIYEDMRLICIQED